GQTPCSCAQANPGAAPTPPPAGTPDAECSARANELLVAPVPNPDARGLVEKVLRDEGVEIDYRPSLDVFVVRAGTRRQREVLEERLRRKSPVLFVEPNYGYRPGQSSPPVDDPLFDEQWALDDPPRDADVNAPDAWKAVAGRKPGIVGIVDSGVDFGSVELDQARWNSAGGMDFTTSPPAKLPQNGSDGTGHGTKVASIIAADTDNRTAIAAVAPRALLVACRASAADCATADAVASCIEHLAGMESQVVAANVSLSGTGCSCTVEREIRESRDEGMLVVASAGNEGTSNDVIPRYPASYPVSNVIAVAATNPTPAMSHFNRGPRTVHLGAPGTGVITLRAGGDPQSPGTTTVHGTSFAAPHVSGVLSLLAANGVKDWRKSRKLVITSGVPLSTAAARKETISGRTLRAWDRNGQGALTCKGQSVWKRIQPVADVCAMPGGQDSMVVRAFGAECDESMEPRVEWKQKHAQKAKWQPLGMRDDGQYPDETADDGEWAGMWRRPPAGKTYKLVVRDPKSPTSEKDSLKVIR
ncbi:MAG: S8 family serine peptidase, partial [Candidatus Binatia bacterium]